MVLNFSVGYVGVLIAALAYFFLGFLWYSKIFGARWRKAIGVSEKEAMKKDGMLPRFIVYFLSLLVLVYVLEVLLVSIGVIGLQMALTLVLLLWVGFILPFAVSPVLWQNKPIELFFIDAGYHLVGLVISVFILGWF